MAGQKIYKDIVTPEFVAYLPQLAERNQWGAFSVHAVFEDPKALAKIEAACQEVWNAEHPGKPIQNSPIRTGDSDIVPEGKTFMVLKTTKAFRAVDRVKAPIDPNDIYAGCICKAVITLTTYKSGRDVGVTRYLKAIQFVKDGEPVESGYDDTDMFDDFEEDFG